MEDAADCKNLHCVMANLGSEFQDLEETSPNFFI